MSLKQKLSRALGIDFHIVLTLLMRSWTALAGVVMVLGLPKWFTQAEQGYYFTFYSLLGLQVFFELGFNFVVTQVVSHELAALDLDLRANVPAGDPRLDRLTSLVRLLRRWYAVAAVLFFFGVGAAGMVFFESHGARSESGWLQGWLLLVLCSAANLYLSPFLAVAEGIGMVGQVARLRLVLSLVGYGLLWTLLNSGLGLAAVPVVSFVGAAGGALWLSRPGRFIGQLAARPMADPDNAVSWRREIFPFQWRIALSWMSGYLIFQLFNPVIFAYQGPVEAGRLGLGLTIFNTLLSISMSWVMAKAPVIAGHIARGDPDQARHLMWQLVLRSGVFHMLASGAILAGVWVLQHAGIALGARVVGLPMLACIYAATQINHFISSVAVYLRAFKSEPLLANSLAVGVLSLLAVFAGAHDSVQLTMALYLAVTALVALPWLLVVYARFQKSLPATSVLPGAALNT
jgi:hypothetical protein